MRDHICANVLLSAMDCLPWLKNCTSCSVIISRRVHSRKNHSPRCMPVPLSLLTALQDPLVTKAPEKFVPFLPIHLCEVDHFLVIDFCGIRSHGVLLHRHRTRRPWFDDSLAAPVLITCSLSLSREREREKCFYDETHVIESVRVTVRLSSVE